MMEVMHSLEYDLEPLALTGVEDRLQDKVHWDLTSLLSIFLYHHLLS